jgi:class 3 adenylate cyclase
MPNPYLEWIDENQNNRRIEIVDRICVGRSCRGIDSQKRVLLAYPLVSRDHAEINYSAGKLRITDNSRNGTWVNDVRMAAGSTKTVSDGDSIRIGYSVLRVVYPKDKSEANEDHTYTELTMVSSVEEVVTALVADVRGFSAFCQTHASADVFGMINEIFDQFSRIIDDFRGTVKDYAGDSVVAFWEHRFEEPSRQSALACLTAIQQVLSFNKIRNQLSGKFADVENLRMGWGITTGPVTLSQFGSRSTDLAMVGDSINLASRLSGMANKDIPESVLICAQTADLIADRMTLKDLGMHRIQGRRGREHIFTISVA